MAVKPANSRYHTFTFNGVRAADYGIYVTDVNVFNSAARDVEYIEIPGRDGAFALDRGRFQNISVVYKCAMAQDTDEDFATAISEFRNAIASTKGYKRLEDDIHTDEYRMGVFSKGLEAPTLNTKTATFDVEFNCQPQRFLKSGENPRTIGGDVTNTKTESGSIVSIESDGGDAVTSLVAQIEPVQAGSGDPSPSNVRPITGTSTANVMVTNDNLLTLETWDGFPYNSAVGTTLTPTRSTKVLTDNGNGSFSITFASTWQSVALMQDVSFGGTFRLKATVDSTRQLGISGYLLDENFKVLKTVIGNSVPSNYNWLQDLSEYPDTKYVAIAFTNRASANTTLTITKPQLSRGTGSPVYHPPIGHTTHVPLGQTVYSGTVDVVTGVLTVTHGFKTYDGSSDESWAVTTGGASGGYRAILAVLDAKGANQKIESNFLTSEIQSGAKAWHGYIAANKTLVIGIGTDITTVENWRAYLSSHNLQVAYELATPQTYNLTAQQVELLTGNNTVWADTGDITLTYGDDPNKIVNPTLFESHPLLHLWGYGNIGINGEQLSINNDQYGNILLVDKTTHEATSLHTYIYHNSVSPNPKVSLLNEGDTLTLVRGSFIYIQLYGRPVVRFTNVSVSVGGGISASVPSGATQIKNILLTFPEYTFSFGTARAETIPITITAAYTYEGAQRTATVTGDIRVVYSVGSSYQAISIAIINITNTGSADFSVVTNPDKNGTLQAIYGYSTKRPFADDADFYFDLDIGEAYKIEDGHTISVNNAVTIPAKLPTLKSGVNTITYDDTITQFKIVPRWWEV